MPVHKKGRLWRFDVDEVDEWIKIMRPLNESRRYMCNV